MAEHKVGDRVRIRSKEWVDAQEKDSDGGIYKPSLSMARSMLRYAGMNAVITKVGDYGVYTLDIDEGNYAWRDCMFDPGYSEAPLSVENAMRAMLDGEELFDKDGYKWRWDAEHKRFVSDDRKGIVSELAITGLFALGDLRRSAPKRKRLMTLWETLMWASSADSFGWLVRCGGDRWRPPQFYSYHSDTLENYQRARLLPDLSGIDESTIQGFEAEE
jgi:hypothetical protein